ncbi:hypothetical protein ACFQDN_23705 [Pseudomonas asuensis]|uniref:Uncharacterized protein n=1 Tax=Pseudomonas asuensis TaxID=1825787 RepID=A0ABQ2H4I9_9PSED|nr:hypothetical protein [Pseudomonas asuensis]GGM30739.1 hypothetical protein GCM10009425_46730 [Pseudomonas asuensis]
MSRAPKRIYCFRTMNQAGELVDVSKVMIDISDALSIGESEIRLFEDVVRIQRFKDSAVGRLYHLARYSPGTRSSTLTPKANGKLDTEGSLGAPTGKEFKTGESYLLINEHNVLFCGHGLTYQKCAGYIFRLIKDQGYDVEPITLHPSSNIDKVMILNAQGAKSIRLNVNAYKLSVPKANTGWFGEVLASVGEEVKALISKDPSRSQEKSLEDMTVALEISLEGNSRATVESKDTITDLANEVLSDDDSPVDSFTIITRDGTPITSEDVKLHSAILVEKKGTSLDHVQIWDGMVKYFGQLKKQKLLEQ